MKSRLNSWWRYYVAKIMLLWLTFFLVYSCIVDYITNVKNKELTVVFIISICLIYTVRQLKKIYTEN